MPPKDDRPVADAKTPQLTELLTRYHTSRPLYDKLSDEVAFSLEKRIREHKIPYAHISNRVKSLESLSSKLERKHYDDPWKEITDIAGVRIVYLYSMTRARIEAIIEKEFKVLEKVDKLAALDDNQFGYGALHYVVGLSDATSGARYEDLKHLVCEIQVRTVMQDAWAIMDHHLVYKNEASVPSQFKRRLNTISGMFENIDDQFDRMRSEREAYVKVVKKQSESEQDFLKQEVNFETLSAYLKRRFPEVEVCRDSEHFNKVIQSITEHGVKKLEDVEQALKRSEGARAQMPKITPTPYSVGEVARAVAFIFPEYRNTSGWSKERRTQFKALEHLVEIEKGT